LIKGDKFEPLVSWRDIHESIPWAVILLGGGALAIAAGFEVIYY
jgi:hypothetical protein